MNLNRRYLSRFFKEKTGMSIQEYLIYVRMEEAKRRAAEQKEQHGERKKIQPKRDETRDPTTEAGRIDDRPYARGRSYQADRYDNKE